MKSFDQVIRLDQLRHANRHEGRMADQNLSSTSAKIAAMYWRTGWQNVSTALAFLTLSGVNYTQRNNGAANTGSDLQFLEFGADVTAPTDKRRARWNGTTKALEVGGATSAITAADTPTWGLFVQLKAFAKDQFLRGIRGEGGEETFHVF